MAPVGPLFLLYLLSEGSKGSGGGRKQAPSPYDFPPDPVTPPRPLQPTPAVYRPAGPPSPWMVYSPLSQQVIARAEQILADPSAHEVIEPDPSRPGESVRYLRLKDPTTGKTNVTAWMPRHPASAAAPGVVPS